MQNRKGFTLIELLIVVVIIGILAAIAIPKFANTKEKAVLASMKSDLRNLVTAQEGFFSDEQTYAGGIAAAQSATAVAFVPSTNNSIVISGNTAAGWSAVVTNATLTGTINTCGIYAGTAAGFPNANVTAEGAPACY
ncbi:MAG: prepilin-type N-terminal cleavage/methylation domain-containing protein [Gemmatimonadales bacterium]|nr:prepilin-type N-terminal cleavage/methylation domain-containing protein [Gemmatimonadales bacterium]